MKKDQYKKCLSLRQKSNMNNNKFNQPEESKFNSTGLQNSHTLNLPSCYTSKSKKSEKISSTKAINCHDLNTKEEKNEIIPESEKVNNNNQAQNNINDENEVVEIKYGKVVNELLSKKTIKKESSSFLRKTTFQKQEYKQISSPKENIEM